MGAVKAVEGSLGDNESGREIKDQRYLTSRRSRSLLGEAATGDDDGGTVGALLRGEGTVAAVAEDRSSGGFCGRSRPRPTEPAAADAVVLEGEARPDAGVAAR